MSRISFPTEFSNQVDLLLAIDAKNAEAGAASPLKHYLIQHNIDLTAAKATATDAQTHDSNRTIYAKQANNYRQLRDMKFEPVFATLKKEAQFLKSLFGNNYSELGNWGINIDANGRITYPAAFASRKQLWDAFYKKHSSYTTGGSPLDIYLTQQNIHITDDNTDVQYANGCEASNIKTTKLAENETQIRDILWQPIIKIMRGIGDFLKNLYGDNDRQLGLWGFTVDYSERKPKIRTTKLKLGEERTINAIVLGSTLENIGATDILAHKGRAINGNAITLKPGERIGIAKGWSTATIRNLSKLETAVFQVSVMK